MTDTLRLCCFIVNRIHEKPFEVEVGTQANVEVLKEAVHNIRPVLFKEIDASQLRLFKVSTAFLTLACADIL